MTGKPDQSALSNDKVRTLILEYFYQRNQQARSVRGKKGAEVRISDLKTDLKRLHGLTQQQVVSNLTYLISHGWIKVIPLTKQVKAKGGTVIPSATTYYGITAAGIDKVEGPGKYAVPRFHGISIEATGQNVIVLGDGNVVNAEYGDLGSALAELRKAVMDSTIPELDKMSIVADIETMQSQLAKPKPVPAVLAAAWESVKAVATVHGFTGFLERVGVLIERFLP